MYPLRALIAPVAVAALLLTAAPQAQAFAPDTHHEIARDALALSPKYLQVLLQRYQAAVLEGARGPKDKKDAVEFNGAEQDYLESDIPEHIEKQAERIRKLIQKPGNMREIAYRLGLISYYVSLASNPLNIKNEDENERFYRNLFDAYVKKERGRFRVVFRGYDTSLFRTASVEDYMTQHVERNKRYYASLSGEFMKNGKIADIASFSPQSVPFAVASIAYSNAVTTTVDVWKGVWRYCGGDPTPPGFLQAESE